MKFHQILEELQAVLETDLDIDDKDSCSILFEDEITMQIELDDYKNSLIIAASIEPLPPGKYREKILQIALQENAFILRSGILSYREETNSLIVFDSIYLSPYLTAENIKEKLTLLVDYALKWKKAIQNSDLELIKIMQKEKKLYLK